MEKLSALLLNEMEQTALEGLLLEPSWRYKFPLSLVQVVAAKGAGFLQVSQSAHHFRSQALNSLEKIGKMLCCYFRKCARSELVNPRLFLRTRTMVQAMGYGMCLSLTSTDIDGHRLLLKVLGWWSRSLSTKPTNWRQSQVRAVTSWKQCLTVRRSHWFPQREHQLRPGLSFFMALPHGFL